MSNQTVSSDINMATVISNGLANGQNITITGGALLTSTASPTVLLGQITINDGELFFDGENAVNPIVVAGEVSEEINVNGAGILRTSLGWWDFPTTGDGTAGQTFDCSTYFSSSGSGISSDVFGGVWVETGRRINYSGGSGVAPVVGDWLFKTSDNDVHGRIEAVSGDEVTGYVVVTFLTGSLTAFDAIELHTIQDNKGPEYQKSWTANTIGTDVLEAGVFQEFGNAHQDSADRVMGSGMAGFGFWQTFQSNTLTFGDGTNGFVVPNGARVRVPMVHFVTSTTALYPTGVTSWQSNNSSAYNIETQNGGDVYLYGASIGSAYFEDQGGNRFEASYCAAQGNLGVYKTLGRPTYSHCIFSCPSIGTSRSISRSVPPVVDLINGADLSDCLGLFLTNASDTTNFGGQTSVGVNLTRIIQISSAVQMDFEVTRHQGVTINDLVVIGTSLRLVTATDVSINLLKTQREIQGGTIAASTDQIVCTANTARVAIIGWEVLQGSAPDDSKISLVDCTDVKIRGFHFADDPYDNDAGNVSASGEEFIAATGLCQNLDIARCYQTGGSPATFGNFQTGSTKTVLVQNCGGDYTGGVNPTGLNVGIRGLRAGSGSLGGSTGVETDYVGTIGHPFLDIFRSDTSGAIALRHVDETSEYPIDIVSGNPKFTKDGDVDCGVGDQWIVDMNYSAKGHTSFTGVITTSVSTGAASDGVDEWSGVDIEFQYDVGAGFNGTWLDLRTPSNLTSITGMATGIRLKLRMTPTTNVINANGVVIHTTTTPADQLANLHPIDQNEATLTLNGLIDNTEVRIYDATGTELAGVENSTGGEFSYTYVHSGADVPAIIVVHALGYINQRISYTLTAVNATIPIQQQVDRQYENA